MLTVVPSRPPSKVDRPVAAAAMLVAPLVVIPLALAVGLAGWGGREAGVSPLVLGFGAVGLLALGNRSFHVDGLADVADALTASYDRERSLEVMVDSTSGPAAIAMLIVTLGIQASAFASLFTIDRGPVVAAVLVCASRAVLSVTCATGVPPASEPGLAADYAGIISRRWTALSWLVTAGALTGVLAWAGGTWWLGLVAAVVALGVVALVLHRAVQRFGGVTGDVFGATIELALAALLIVATII
jgi:adenosylcobinamide-GDP ribazoletransferase